MVKRIYRCDICSKEFDNIVEATLHEEEHSIKCKFVCDCCGKEYEYVSSHKDYPDVNILHHINLGRAGYGSSFDGCDLDINLCDDCLKAYVETFCEVGKHKILDSGVHMTGV